MKKLSESRWRWLADRARKTPETRKARQIKRSNNFNSSSARTAMLYRRGRYMRSTWLHRHGNAAPGLFCLDRNRDEVLEFIESLDRRLGDAYYKFRARRPTRKNPAPWLDFSTIDEITPSAALVLAAEFDRWRTIAKSRLLAIEVEKWRPQVAKTLKQIGLFELLDIDVNDEVNVFRRGDQDGSIILRMQSGDEHDGAKLAWLKERLVAIAVAALGVPDQDEESAIRQWRDRFVTVYTILSEAMDNVVEHAYRSMPPSSSRTVRRWWMTAAVDASQRRLIVALYDQGASIPATLPAWHNFNRVQRVWSRLFGSGYDPDNTDTDGIALRTALKVAVSSTNQEFRGKGLSTMAEFLTSCRSGRLRIISRCGTMVKEKGSKPMVETHAQRLSGTLIEWDVSL